MVAVTIRSAWSEVKKSNPCPLCSKPDWCSVSDTGSAVLCRRTDPGSQPSGWKHIKDSSDGFPIFAQDLPENFFNPFPPARRSRSKARGARALSPVPLPSTPPALATSPSKPSDSPRTDRAPFIPDWLIERDVPPNATETRYSYSKTQWVSRFEWPDASNPKGHEKTVRPAHIRPDGTTKWTKGAQDWNPYRLEEARALGRDKWVLGLEGEPCVETARSLGLVAITWQGGSWTEEDLANGLQQLQAAGVTGLVYWPDRDEAGEKKARQIEAAAARIGFPVVVLDPVAIWSEMPLKGDITDWVAWGKERGMSESDFVGQLEEEFRKEVERRQLKEVAAATDEAETSDPPLELTRGGEITRIVLESLYGDQPWLCVNDKLYCWTGTHYRHSADVIEQRRIADFLDQLPVVDRHGNIGYPHAKPSRVKQCLEWVKIRSGVDPGLVNPPGLNCTNGVLEIHWSESTPNWRLVPHDPNRYYLYEPLVTYNPLAASHHCDRLLECLDAPQREIFLRTIAASLDLATVRKYRGRLVRALLLKGDGNNGKDTLREAVAALYGYQGLTGATLEDFANYDNGRKFPLARTAGSRVNWASENANFSKLDRIQSLKAFVTGDTISIERKGVDEWDFQPTAVALFNVNDVPRLDGALEAIRSRYGILTFTKTFKVGADPAKGEIEADARFKYDPSFLRKQVLSAFLNRVLGGLLDLMREGIDYSPTERALEDIQAHNSHLWQFCQEMGLGYVPGAVTTAGEIWETLKGWYTDNGTLAYEESANGKLKAIWTEQAGKGDLNIKGANQIIPRFQALFPKAARVTVGKGKMALSGIRFTGDRSEPVPMANGEAVSPSTEAIVSQVVSLEPLPHKDGEPVTPVEEVFPKKDREEKNPSQSSPPIETEKNKNSGGEMPRLTHPVDTARVSAPPVPQPCLTESPKLAHPVDRARVSASEASREEGTETTAERSTTTEPGAEIERIEWVRYRGEVYMVAGIDGQTLSLRKSGTVKIVHRVHLSRVEIGEYKDANE